MMRKIFFIVLIFLVISNFQYPYAFPQSDPPLGGGYEDRDTYFLQLRSRLQKKISQEERSKINFAIGEYYFQSHAFHDTYRTFKDYIRANPVGVSTLLANVYLYKIASLNHQQEKIEEIKREIFKDKFILLFANYKILTYTSLFGNDYEIRHFVDKIEVFLNQDAFEQIAP